jgi:hypothetical protein
MSTMNSMENLEKSRGLVFASTIFPRRGSETNALLLAESIRAFAGSFNRAPIWFFTPEHGEQLSEAASERLHDLDVTLIKFEVDPEVVRFPFTSEAIAAALAESRAYGRADFLAWLNANTIVLQEPGGLILREGKSLGYRPVHHINVGSRYGEDLDPFWTLVYGYCDVPEDRVFPMATHVDGEVLRPYFNAGCHVSRPGKQLLRAWRDTYLEVYREPAFQELYQQDGRYRVFIHQAVLSGVILSALATDELQELPPEYNYPLHLHGEDVTGHRPSSLEELVTVRHEGFYADPDWARKMPAGEPLKRWIAERLP